MKNDKNGKKQNISGIYKTRYHNDIYLLLLGKKKKYKVFKFYMNNFSYFEITPPLLKTYPSINLKALSFEDWQPPPLKPKNQISTGGTYLGKFRSYTDIESSRKGTIRGQLEKFKKCYHKILGIFIMFTIILTLLFFFPFSKRLISFRCSFCSFYFFV